MAEPFVKNLNWARGIGTDGRPKLLAGLRNDDRGHASVPVEDGGHELAVHGVQSRRRDCST